MKWQMAENSLFAVLLRSPWWMSLSIAAGIGVVASALLPEAYKLVGAVSGFPFAVIGAIAAWRQFQKPSAARVERTLEAVKAMSWIEFAAALEQGYRADGYSVKRLEGANADFEIGKEWRTFVVSARRWKAARVGIEPLRDLHAVREAREVRGSIFVFAGEVTDNARAFAAEKRIDLVTGPELSRLLPALGQGKKAG